jgi:hypothetical protein
MRAQGFLFHFTRPCYCAKLDYCDRIYREGIHMDSADVVKMQEEFVKSMSEFSTRFLAAWTDAAKRMGLQQASENLEKLGAGWVDLSPFVKMIGSTAAAEKLEEAVKRAAEDLPLLAASWGDPEKADRIKNKWVTFCEKSVRGVLGIPGPSDTAKLLDQWRWATEFLPSVQGRHSAASVPGFIGLMSPSGWPLPGIQDAQREMFRTWADNYGKTFGRIPLFPAKSLGEDYEERTRKALAAQVQFLQCLPDFHAHIAVASKSAVETVFENLHKLGLKETTAESRRLFFASWVSASEKLFQGLFESDAFLQTLTKAVQQGLDAKTKMQSIMADWSSAWNLAHHTEVEDLRDKLYTVEKRVRLLERELEDIKRELSKPLPQEAGRTGHEE